MPWLLGGKMKIERELLYSVMRAMPLIFTIAVGFPAMVIVAVMTLIG